MVNSLTRQAGVKLGPLLLETLVKHYFDRLVKESESQGRAMTKLRQDELLYDEAFNIVKVRPYHIWIRTLINATSDISRGFNEVSVDPSNMMKSLT